MISADEIPEIHKKSHILDAKYKILYTIGEGRYAKYILFSFTISIMLAYNAKE